MTADAWAAHKRVDDEIRALEERRANWIDPDLVRRRSALWMAAYAIEKRLRRHRDWPARYRRAYERQMYEHGYCWAEEPPAYLISR